VGVREVVRKGEERRGSSGGGKKGKKESGE
jgi:hypothetical protein